jgi:predicted protein tyrosine phosphatase
MLNFWQNRRQMPSDSKENKNSNQRSQNRFKIDWVIPEQIAIGPLPKDRHVELFYQSRIRSILSLCSEEEGAPPKSLSSTLYWERCTLPDSHWITSLTVEELSRAVEKLHKIQAQNAPVYVHCVAAMERSPTVCIAYLCCYNKLEVLEALRYLKQVHPLTAPTSEQLKVVQAFIKIKNYL